MKHLESGSDTGLVIPTVRSSATLFGRALTLRCPNCGGGPVRRHWLKMRERCESCGIRIERGEHDYFMGSMMFNLVIGEFLVVLVTVGVMLARWPNVPWDFLEVGVPLLAILFPVFLFPFSKLIWLAFDLMLRPMTPQELEWHRAGAARAETRAATREP